MGALLPSLISDVLPWLMALFAGVVALLTNNAVQRRKGRKDAENDMERKDRERADDIRRRARDADGVQYDDAGYRD